MNQTRKSSEIIDLNDSERGTTPIASSNDVEQIISQLLPAAHPGRKDVASALVPWICDVLVSGHSIEAYGRDLGQFFSLMKSQGVEMFDVTADHLRVYKASLLKAGVRPATVARRLSVIRGSYQQFAKKGLIDWEQAQGIQAVIAPPVNKNSTPALTQQQAIRLLRVVPTESLQGIRDLALLQTFFSTACRVSAIIRARVGDVEFDGVDYYLNVTEKRNKEARKLLANAAKPIVEYLQRANIENDREGFLFRPLRPDRNGLVPRSLDRKTPWRIVKKYCRMTGIEPDGLNRRGIGVHSLRKTAINNAIRNGATLHQVREFAGHSDIRTTELYFIRREEDADDAARCVQIRVT